MRYLLILFSYLLFITPVQAQHEQQNVQINIYNGYPYPGYLDVFKQDALKTAEPSRNVSEYPSVDPDLIENKQAIEEEINHEGQHSYSNSY